MIDAPLAYAFTAGLVATVNPCGFPMLPAYLSYFMGTDDAEVDGNGRVGRALVAGSAVSIGFLAVFATLGTLVNAGLTWIYRAMPWLTLVVGAGLLAMGVAMLAGRRIEVALPRLDRGGDSRSFGSMIVFGISYAVASLSCTLPVFLTVVAGTAQRVNPVSGMVTFLAYGLGMSVVLLVVSLAVALARESMVRRMRQALRYADRVAGVLLVVVGGYLLIYGVYAMDPLNAAVSPVAAVGDWSAAASSWLLQGGIGLGWVMAAAVILSGMVVVWRRRSLRPPEVRPCSSPATVTGGEHER